MIMGEKNTTEAKKGPLSRIFYNTVGRKLGNIRLGDILLSAGLITQDQLDTALTTQRDGQGEQLGQILVRQGALSAAQLYRKLAEQWCLKAATLGMGLMMSVGAPLTAHAAGSSGSLASTFQVASAGTLSHTITPQSPRMHYPELFGYHEIRSNNIQPFTKWTGMLTRFSEELTTDENTPVVKDWKNELDKLKDKPLSEQIRAVNNYVNQVRYVSDIDNYGKSDYWATPIQFFKRGGDCEDYAIAKYASLRALGVPNKRLRIAIVEDEVEHLAHAILVVYTDHGAEILDNQNKHVEPASDVTRYKPIFSINRTSWWLHKA